MKFFNDKRVRIAITIILSSIFLYIVFRSLEWNKILSSFKNYNLWWLLPVVFLIIFSIVIRAMRWKIILKPVKLVRTHLLFEAIVLSYFTNILLPINIGEIVRAYILKKKVKISMFSVFGSVAIERIISILGFLIVGIFVVVFITLPTELIGFSSKVITGLKISTAIFFLLIIMVVLVKKYRESIAKAIHYISCKLSKKHSKSVIHHYENFLKGLRFGTNKIDFSMIIIYSIFMRILYGFITLSIARGFGVELPLLTFLFIDILVSFAHSIGGHLLGIVGTYEAALTYSLAFFGVPKEIGLGIALISDATFIIPSLLLGLIYFLKEGLTIRKLRALRR